MKVARRLCQARADAPAQLGGGGIGEGHDQNLRRVQALAQVGVAWRMAQHQAHIECGQRPGFAGARRGLDHLQAGERQGQGIELLDGAHCVAPSLGVELNVPRQVAVQALGPGGQLALNLVIVLKSTRQVGRLGAFTGSVRAFKDGLGRIVRVFGRLVGVSDGKPGRLCLGLQEGPGRFAGHRQRARPGGQIGGDQFLQNAQGFVLGQRRKNHLAVQSQLHAGQRHGAGACHQVVHPQANDHMAACRAGLFFALQHGADALMALQPACLSVVQPFQ